MLDNTSEESEEEDEKEEDENDEFNRLMMTSGQSESIQNLNGQLQQSSGGVGNFYKKFKAKQKDKQFTSNLAKKGRNRLIRSMQNLANFRSRSRSNSADSVTSNEAGGASSKSSKSKKSPNETAESASSSGGGKSDLIKSFFVRNLL